MVRLPLSDVRPKAPGMPNHGFFQENMYGLIGKMTAVTGQRDALIAILLEATQFAKLLTTPSAIKSCNRQLTRR